MLLQYQESDSRGEVSLLWLEPNAFICPLASVDGAPVKIGTVLSSRNAQLLYWIAILAFGSRITVT